AERAHTSLTGIGVADHHARYTDVEAQAQAAALIVIHTALAAAHHARYTNAEAQATVKANVEVGDLKAPTKPLPMNNQEINTIGKVLINATGRLRIPVGVDRFD
ncbi:unnamed protein product, partial [marine sediment metagenome]